MHSSRELVRRAIEFDHPWRMPVCSSPMRTEYAGDVVYVFPQFDGNPWWLGQGGADEWGCVWALSENTKDMGQVVGHPLTDLRDLGALQRPNGLDPSRYMHLDDQLAPVEDRYVAFCNGTCLFERAHMLRGFAQFLEDLYDDPEAVAALLDAIIGYHEQSVQYLSAHFPGRIHAYRVTDDWGSQQGPMIHPDLFRELFFPRYQRLFAQIHAAGMHVWLHSCGKHEAILDQLIEAGLDVANLCQPAIFDIPSFGKRFAGRLAFEAAGDMQKTLPTNDPAAIRAEADDLIRHWTTEAGGWLLVTDVAPESTGIPLEAVVTMQEAFLAADRWQE
jgi:uroporphyrinogen decarboxylase